jgi:hypothetical protein
VTLPHQRPGNVRHRLSHLLTGTRTFWYTDDPLRTRSLYSPGRQTDDEYIFENSKLLGGCTVSTGKYLPTLQRSGTSGQGCMLLSMKATRFFETSVIIYQTSRRSIAADLNLHIKATSTSSLARFSFTRHSHLLYGAQ